MSLKRRNRYEKIAEVMLELDSKTESGTAERGRELYNYGGQGRAKQTKSAVGQCGVIPGETLSRQERRHQESGQMWIQRLSSSTVIKRIAKHGRAIDTSRR